MVPSSCSRAGRARLVPGTLVRISAEVTLARHAVGSGPPGALVPGQPAARRAREGVGPRSRQPLARRANRSGDLHRSSGEPSVETFCWIFLGLVLDRRRAGLLGGGGGGGAVMA